MLPPSDPRILALCPFDNRRAWGSSPFRPSHHIRCPENINTLTFTLVQSGFIGRSHLRYKYTRKSNIMAGIATNTWEAAAGRGHWKLIVQKDTRRGEGKRTTQRAEKRNHRKQSLQFLRLLSPQPSPAAHAAETAMPEWVSCHTHGELNNTIVTILFDTGPSRRRWTTVNCTIGDQYNNNNVSYSSTGIRLDKALVALTAS